jgi:hypothetical protein
MYKSKIIVYRKWNNKEIKVAFTKEEVRIETGLEDFREQMLKTIESRIPDLGLNLSSKKIREITMRAVQESFDEMISDMKQQTQ